MPNIMLNPPVRLRNKSILSTLKVEKVLKIRLSEVLCGTGTYTWLYILIHGKISNWRAEKLNQFNITLQIYTNISDQILSFLLRQKNLEA